MSKWDGFNDSPPSPAERASASEAEGRGFESCGGRQLTFRIAGYGRSDQLASDHLIPQELLLDAFLAMAGIERRPGDPFVDYKLSELQATRLLALLGHSVRNLDYYFEISHEPPPRGRRSRR